MAEKNTGAAPPPRLSMWDGEYNLKLKQKCRRPRDDIFVQLRMVQGAYIQVNSASCNNIKRAVQRVIVCETQVPFVRGGAESLVRELVRQLRFRGHEAELVSIPFKAYPKEQILSHAAAWRLLDLSESNGRPIDLVIASKFPTYCVRHPNKVAWLVHQHREAYDLLGTPYSNLSETEADTDVRARLLSLDREMLGECQQLFTISRTASARLERFNGIRAEALYPPPRLATALRAGSQGNYVLSVGRLEGNKRVDLVVGTMRDVVPPIRLVVVGEGSQRMDLERATEALGLGDRVDFVGWVDDDMLIDLYANALAVVYPPYDEDYGYVTLEAFLARKPVLTTTDAGGPLEFVEHEINGLVSEPSSEALAAAINRFAGDRRWAAELGAAGFERARHIRWDPIIEHLTVT